MQEASKLLSFDHVFRKSVLRDHPELEGQEFETEFKHGINCPKCGAAGDQGTGALFYRVKDGEWIQSGQTHKCQKCRDAEALNVYMESSLREQRQQIAQRLAKEYFQLPDNLKNAGFKNYSETNKTTSKAKKDAMDYVKFLIAGEKSNLLIMGNPGTGKSHLCAAIARTMQDKGFTVGFLTTGKLLSMIKATYNKGAAKTEQGIFEDLNKLDLMIFDDIGAESTGGNEDWRKAMVFELVESRSAKPTIYTSNLTDTDLPKAVGGRVFSRLYDNTKFIDLFIENYDYRKNKMIK